MEPDLNLVLYSNLLTILYSSWSMGIPEVMPFHQISVSRWEILQSKKYDLKMFPQCVLSFKLCHTSCNFVNSSIATVVFWFLAPLTTRTESIFPPITGPEASFCFCPRQAVVSTYCLTSSSASYALKENSLFSPFWHHGHSVTLNINQSLKKKNQWIFFFNWRVIALQCCGGLFHTSERLSPNYTCVSPLSPTSYPSRLSQPSGAPCVI